MSTNVRSSHFVLGNTNQQSQFVSTMKLNFQNETNKNQNKGNSLPSSQLRASHFGLGESKNNYQTSFKNHYKPHFEFTCAKLDDEKKFDLKTNHFLLGHNDGQKISMTKQTYTQKPIHNEVHHEQEAQKAKMRSHHHNFAETEPKIMRTYYNQQYQAYGQDSQIQNNTKEELKERAIGLGQSHIILGKDQNNFITVQQKDYQDKGLVANFIKVESAKSHFEFGIQKNDFATSNQELGKLAQNSKNSDQSNLVNQQQIRASHIKIGQEHQPYITEMNTKFRPYSQDQVPQRVSNQNQSNNFQIGDPRFPKIQYQTQYKQAMQPPLTAENLQLDQHRNDRGSNFTIGNWGNKYQTESNSNYTKPENGKAANLEQKIMNEIRGSHFKFNDINQNNFQTTTAQSYANVQGGGVPNKLNQNTQENLRKHHFTIGQDQQKLISSMHDAHRPLGDAKPNQLNENQAKQLRTQHFKFQ